MQIREIILLNVNHYGHVSTAVAVIIRVVYKITGLPNKLLKCLSEQLTVTKRVSNFVLSCWMSASEILKCDKIQIP